MKLLRKIAAYMLSACISLPVMNAEAFSPKAESPPSYQLDNEMIKEKLFPYYEVKLPKIHIGYFYISLADETGKLQFKFGKGKCPNRAFLFHMGCTDSDTGKKIEKADITITDSDSNSASASLPTDVWLKPGTYQVTANAENYTACTPRTYIVGYLPVSSVNIAQMPTAIYKSLTRQKKLVKMWKSLSFLIHKFS